MTRILQGCTRETPGPENDSGFLEEAEGHVFLGVTGCAEEELAYCWSELLRAADSNGVGKLSKAEFVTYLLGTEALDGAGDFVSAARKSEMRARLDVVNSVYSCVRDMEVIHGQEMQRLKHELEEANAQMLSSR
jgi:hypothetical protein